MFRRIFIIVALSLFLIGACSCNGIAGDDLETLKLKQEMLTERIIKNDAIKQNAQNAYVNADRELKQAQIELKEVTEKIEKIEKKND